MKDLSTLSDEKLIALRVATEQEMTKRGITFTVGRIGETLAIDYFSNTPGLPNLIDAPKGAKNVDALSRDGERYSIKTRQAGGGKTGAIYADKEHPDKQLFEQLLIVQLNPDYTLKSIHRFSWNTFLEVRAWDSRMTAWYVPISNKRLVCGEQIFPTNQT